MSLLGVDMGTSACKAVAFSRTGAILASSSSAYARRGQADSDNELDASVFWGSFVEAVRKTARAVGRDRVEALAVSCHGETIIPLDARGEACGPALLNRDNRSGPMLPAWERRFGREGIYATTGLPLHAMYSLPKLLWLKENRPGVFADAKRFVSVADFLLLRMALPPVIDYTMASRVMGFDIGRLQWSDELLGFVGLTPSSFSEPRPSGTVVGKLDAAHARALSLDAGVTVALGGHDQPCGAFGAGAVEPGCAVISAGSYECITLVADGPKNGAAALCSSLNSYPHVVSGKYVVLGFFPSGIVLDWLIANIFTRDPEDEAERRDALALAQREAEKLGEEPTGICMTPHILGSGNPYWDIRATVSLSGIRPHHGRYHLVKALAEGVAFELATNLRVLDEVAGPVTRCIIHGGGSRWDCGVQLRADVAGRRLERWRILKWRAAARHCSRASARVSTAISPTR